MTDLRLTVSKSREGFEPVKSADRSGASDFSNQNFIAEDDLILEGFFVEKPATTGLTLTMSVDNARCTVTLVSLLVADAVESAYRLNKIPVPKGSVLTLNTTGGVNGHKRVAFVYRTARFGV